MENKCNVIKNTLHSPSMDRGIRYAVSLPNDFGSSTEQYPVLYALHGKGAPYTSWVDMPPLNDVIQTRKAIVAAFDADYASMYVDAACKPDSRFTAFFFDEFIPFIEKEYRIVSDPGHRGITGFSMGGFGAFHYMLLKPDMFSSVSSLSGAFHIFRNDNNPLLASEIKKREAEILGSYEENRERYESNQLNPRLQKAADQGIKLPPLYLHCGTEDPLIEVNRNMRDFLKEMNVPATYLETAGRHDWPFWRDASSRVFDFHWEHFSQSA